MTKVLIAIVVVVLFIGGYMYMSRSNTVIPTPEAVETPTATPPASAGEASTGTVKEFTVAGTSHLRFSLAEMRVNKGDTVRVTFVNEGGNHDWRLDEFNAATKVLNAGQQETVEFVADKAGQFEYYCSVGPHRSLGMKGAFIVEE